MNTCVLFALHRESAPFLRLLGRRKPLHAAPCSAWQQDSLLVLETGVGRQRCLDALHWLFESGLPLPETVISAGFAGALDDGWHVGDVLAAEEIIDGQGKCWQCSGEAKRGRLLTMPRLIGDPEEKRRLGSQHQATAVEMESAAAAQFCQERGIAFLSVRAISDDVSARLSPRLVQLLGGARVSMPRLLLALAAKPSLALELWRLARDTKSAARNLAGVLAKTLEL